MMKATMTALALLALLSGCVVMNPAAPVAPAAPTAVFEPANLDQGSRAIGVFNDNTYFQHDLEIGGDTTVGGALTVTGAITGGSFSPATFTNAADLYADTGTFTTTLKLAGTAVARVSGDAINASSVKVALTPVALLSGSAIDTLSLKVGATPVVVQVGALAAGAKIICGTTTITGTGVLPTTLATPQYVNLTLGQDVTGNCQSLSYTNASATVTAKCFSSALTPAPATTPVAVNWCAIGK